MEMGIYAECRMMNAGLKAVRWQKQNEKGGADRRRLFYSAFIILNSTGHHHDLHPAVQRLVRFALGLVGAEATGGQAAALDALLGEVLLDRGRAGLGQLLVALPLAHPDRVGVGV